MANTAQWRLEVAQMLAARERDDQLPPVSSELSSLLTTRIGVERHAQTHDYDAAMRTLAETYAKVLRTLLPPELLRERSAPPRVLSLCTGYDATVELLALIELFGRVDAYVAVEHDPLAVACNALQLDALPPELGEAKAVASDVRSAAAMAELVDREGPFEFGLVLRPPVTPTAYADERRRGSRAWLSPRVDAPVALELLEQVEHNMLPPLGLVLFAQTEANHLRRMLSAVGYHELAASMRELAHGLEQAPWHTLWMA